MTSLTSLIILLLISLGILAPALAFAQTIGVGITFGGGGNGTGGNANDITGVAGTILFIINDVLVPVLFAVAFIVFLYGVAKAYIFSGGDQAAIEQGHKLILWGLIAFVVMISLWGLVNVVSNTFGLGGYEAPPLPQTPTSAQ
jgi:hypothetical protein